MYIIIDRQTKSVVAKAKNLKAAIAKAGQLDLEYGSARYSFRRGPK